MLNTKRLASASSRLVRMMSHVTSSEAASVPWKEIRIPVPWGHIAGKEWGVEDGEPVLGLHGWQDNCATFDRIAPLLPLSKLRLIALDLPGHGHSSHLPEGAWYRWSDYVTSMARVVDYLKWPQFSLLGHSMGAKMSYIYAGCFPERVNRMVALDMPRPFPGIPRVLFRPPKDINNWDVTEIFHDWTERILKLEQSRVVSKGRPMEEFVEKLTSVTDYLTKDSARVIFNRGTRLVSRDPDLYVLTHDRRLDVYDFLISEEHCEQFCNRINCDLLIVLAAKGVTYYHSQMNVSILGEFKERLKRFQLEYVEGTHHVHINNPERVSPIVSEFLLASNESNFVSAKL